MKEATNRKKKTTLTNAWMKMLFMNFGVVMRLRKLIKPFGSKFVCNGFKSKPRETERKIEKISYIKYSRSIHKMHQKWQRRRRRSRNIHYVLLLLVQLWIETISPRSFLQLIGKTQFAFGYMAIWRCVRAIPYLLVYLFMFLLHLYTIGRKTASGNL